MLTIGQALESKRNNFDGIRLVAALSVLLSHSYPLTGSPFEPFYSYLGHYDTGGGWAVSIFFIISGFLVTQSVVRHDLATYAGSRALRILPPLAVVILLQIFVLGPMVTTISLAEYFTSPKTYEHLKNISMFFRSGTLPGVFTDNPLRSVNGSLWTLSIESAFYIALPVLAYAGFLHPRRILLVLLLAALGYILGSAVYGLGWDNQGGRIMPGLPLYSTLKESLFFLSGSALWVWRNKIRLLPSGATALAVALWIFAGMAGNYYVMFLALPYLVLYFSLAYPIRMKLYERIGDLSYGIYIFAFPVQQTIVHFAGPEMGPTGLSLVAVPITLALAVMTRILVENPAMAARNRLFAARKLAVRAQAA